ncbi:MAG TPA: S8 family serine peptidase, partial [Oligoflexia bacterium]|nr:S8 family serine peptidase [Oligoflexia bacterium]
EVTPDGLRALARTPGIAKIYFNRDVLEEPTINGPNPDDGPDPELVGMPYDFPEMGLDLVMKEMPQITGKGVVVGAIDTGVDGHHPALQGKILTFFDARTGQITEPYDRDDHGTHTAGTIVGGDRSRTLIGVAPEAKLVASAALSSYDHMLRAMEFMLDPDSDPNTADMPRAINNSWNCEGAPDVELFYKAISAWEAAGILPVFSAGNSGRRGMGTITKPHEHPFVLAVGATGPDGRIADFSSRGPGRFRGQNTQKPDLTAPGVDIESTMPGGTFGKMSGTSMAAPHITGAAALLLQVDPALTPIQLKELMMATATPMSEEDGRDEGNWNPHYGVGKTNIYRALQAAGEIRRRRLSGSVIDLMATILTSPREIVVSKFLAKPPKLDIAELAYSTDTQGDGGPDWATSADFEKP